jgi:hypothetical protein
MIRSEDVLFFLVSANRMQTRLKSEESTEFWQISCASVIYTKKATQKMSIRMNILPRILL